MGWLSLQQASPQPGMEVWEWPRTLQSVAPWPVCHCWPSGHQTQAPRVPVKCLPHWIYCLSYTLVPRVYGLIPSDGSQGVPHGPSAQL